MSRNAGEYKFDDTNEFYGKGVGKILSKVNLFEAHFFIPGARVAFTSRKKVFDKASIHHLFHQKCYILIQADASLITISETLYQLTTRHVIHTN